MVKRASKRNTFNYNVNRKKLKKNMIKKQRPRIECDQIRKAWNPHKTAKQNMRDMGLAFGSRRVSPTTSKAGVEPVARVLKPYVVREMEEEANLPRKDTTTCSTDLIEFVQHMIREHGEDYKAMARDEKNYYQDTPKQIKRKVDLYKRCHADEHAVFLDSLKAQTSS
ncbi:nucleolar protein 16 [Tachysurus fulvidraco]|uniref:nucleolar protein 16 n=1 Tax=Tachysurus fulvidraco TaxID=1234273 RepID=UPI001FF022EE|nr:nucleolar protein 16 [Tachysurus fulvidraco]